MFSMIFDEMSSHYVEENSVTQGGKSGGMGGMSGMDGMGGMDMGRRHDNKTIFSQAFNENNHP